MSGQPAEISDLFKIASFSTVAFVVGLVMVVLVWKGNPKVVAYVKKGYARFPLPSAFTSKMHRSILVVCLVFGFLAVPMDIALIAAVFGGDMTTIADMLSLYLRVYIFGILLPGILLLAPIVTLTGKPAFLVPPAERPK
ncbi:hypothetical protein [Salininema proteolyticum]|uniref:Uncharacterized protein n=1 Tax=Salininema proteolyticum TaxID=1607685 RepID=A0ABV8U4X4_9ACTN